MVAQISGEFATFVERLQGQEALDWEIKAAQGGLPSAIWETISAFANTLGGWLILGVAERQGERVVEGIRDPDAMVRLIHEQMRNRQKFSYPICGAQDVTTFDLSNKKVIVVRVPPAPRRVRPVYTRDIPYHGTYVRRDEGDFPATRPEVDRMMREASDLSADQVLLDGYGLNDLDRSTIAGYRRRFQTAHPDHPHNSLNDQDFLYAIEAVRRERETNRRGLTVAGLLVFGKDEAIRAWRGRHLIDFRRLASGEDDQGMTQWDDRVAWEGISSVLLTRSIGVSLMGCQSHSRSSMGCVWIKRISMLRFARHSSTS